MRLEKSRPAARESVSSVSSDARAPLEMVSRKREVREKRGEAKKLICFSDLQYSSVCAY